jgi:hypothetical protein
MRHGRQRFLDLRLPAPMPGIAAATRSEVFGSDQLLSSVAVLSKVTPI